MDERLHEIIVSAIRKSMHRSSDDMAKQVIKDLEAANYNIKKKIESDGTYVRVC